MANPVANPVAVCKESHMLNAQNVELPNFTTNPEILQSWLAIPEVHTDIQRMLRKKNLKCQHMNPQVELIMD